MTAPAVIHHLQFASLPNGMRLHYASAGEQGKPLILFVHGFPEFWYAWERQLAEFGQTHFAVAPDLRGFNLSGKPSDVENYRPRHVAEDLVQLTGALGYTRCVIVAHDWGGAVCWNLAMQHPEIVEKLVIVNAPHPYLFARALTADPAQQAASGYMNWLRKPGSEQALAANDFALLEKMLGGHEGTRPAWFTDAVRARYHAAWSTPGDNDSHALTGSVNYYRATPMRPPTDSEPAADLSRFNPARFDPNCAVVKVPTLVIWGEQDRALPKTLVDGLGDFVPDLRVERIPEGTHWVIHEQPERVNLLIRSTLP
ncbi:alpha/beta fold hydrolase [Cupriavidus pampae]|uniref:Epoxide hydrolase A n=1 Tax=Cupriavidus pampae TaxID=659251 RepID=A0ABM8WAR8_9BURK|nr:alpha/beta hydrolase [Cupriavidus pampae]CAG9164349.1 Epoxide hydrolase A [Cupriavidus pampae]